MSGSTAANRPHRIGIPGKVMLSGEYAVLHGGTAVMLPVPRHLHVSEGDPAAAEEARRWAAEFALEMPLPAIAGYEQQSPLRQVEVDAAEFSSLDAQGSVRKLGLGSSAAEAVGVVALRYQRAGLDWQQHREEVFQAALVAHTEAQGQAGSGADVAACAFGVPLSFRREGTVIHVHPSGAAQLTTPLALAWTGTEANSRRLMQQFDMWLAERDAPARAAVARLVRYAEELAPLWFDAASPDLLGAVDVYCQMLQSIADEAQMTWRLPAHARLESWAKRYGGRAKPTGAGGGDMVLLIGDLPLAKLQQEVIPLGHSQWF